MHTLETKKPLAESQLWQLLRNYYVHKGIEAWTSEETPSFVTSNCYIARYYAQIILHALQDWQQKSTTDAPTTPFYIIELSSGLGEFAFHCLKQLCLLQELYQLHEIKFCYVLADVVEKNIISWDESHAFDDYLARGQADFAYYDIVNPSALHLKKQQIILDSQHLDRPCIVIANYIFDSTPCDAFWLRAGQLRRAMMTLKVPTDFVVDRPQSLAGIMTNIDYVPIASPQVYSEPLYNQLLGDYQRLLSRGVINFPIVALRYLQFLLELGNGQMLLLVADKGYSTLEIMQDIEELHIDYHVSLSFLVNFHALEQFFKYHSGDGFYQDRFTQLTTAIYTAGITLNDMPATQRFLQIYAREMSPQEYCRLVYKLSQLRDLDALSILALFRLTKNDPILLLRFYQQLIQITNPYKINFNRGLRELIHEVEQNIYPLRQTSRLTYILGCVYHVLGDYDIAIKYFQAVPPPKQLEYDYYYRLHDCYVNLNEDEMALQLEPILRRAKWRYRFYNFWYRFNVIKKWLRLLK